MLLFILDGWFRGTHDTPGPVLSVGASRVRQNLSLALRPSDGNAVDATESTSTSVRTV